MNDKPVYKCKPIGSIEVLSKTLGLHPKHLLEVANKVQDSYITFELSPHPKSGKVREVRDAKMNLKRIQKRINSRIFSHVDFPPYLQGGLKATSEQNRDYVENASIHSKCRTLINLDVRNFYPNIKDASVADIYRHFFRFNDDVVETLTKLTTYNGALPQGGCTSSYLANLVFFNNEYRLFSMLNGQGIRYSRLLDDITISSTEKLTSQKCTEIIKLVAAMLTKHSLRLNNSKTKISYREDSQADFEVTGLWIKHKTPKVRKKERRYVRLLVHKCEQQANSDNTADAYHDLWNRTSGFVTKLERLGHPQAKSYRKRLSNILPVYDNVRARQLLNAVSSAMQVPISEQRKLGRIKRYNQLVYQLGILSRTQKKVAKQARTSLKQHYSSVISKHEFWEA